MKQFKFWRNLLVVFAALLSFASCSSDDGDFDTGNLGGIWRQVVDAGVMDAGTTEYTFFPESPTAGRIELRVKGWPDIKENKALNYVVGHTGHIVIFTGKTHDGASKVHGEYDIHELSSSQMVWYRTDSNEEVARFKKVK
uniref:Lipocalin-like domain-containing protein n=1 Tax=Prevotella sp. GTC17253 TaxID=3236793 RepID=A0AB33IQH8_9BACT